MRKESDIVRTVAEQCLVTPRQIKEILSKLRDIVYSDLIDTGKTRVPILGFALGTRVKGSVPARVGRNPFTGTEVMVAAKPPSRLIKVKLAMKSRKLILAKIESLYGPPEEPKKPAADPTPETSS